MNSRIAKKIVSNLPIGWGRLGDATLDEDCTLKSRHSKCQIYNAFKIINKKIKKNKLRVGFPNIPRIVWQTWINTFGFEKESLFTK